MVSSGTVRSDMSKKVAVFFGTDYYNLPRDSNRQEFIERTNDMLDYIRRNCPDFEFIYQPHPNETDEYKYLKLEGFRVGEHTVAEIFLYEYAQTIGYVFSACSGASISAYAMGFESVIFIDTLHGAVSPETIQGYRSYFAGLPETFFIGRYDQPLPKRSALALERQQQGLQAITECLPASGALWVLAADPALALRAAILVKQIKAAQPGTRAVLLMINHRRWELIDAHKDIFSAFDETIKLPNRRVWYSLRPQKIYRAWKTAQSLKKLPLEPGDTLISFCHLLYEENCLLSYFPKVHRVLLIENRWFHFVYGPGSKEMPVDGFKTAWGTHFFNYILEPVLGLHRTIYREYKDGKVLNLFRYRSDLEEVYESTFVLMP